MKPKLILVVGGIALYTLFKYTGALSRQRQEVLKYTNQYLNCEIPAAVTFHPSYLLRQPSQKKLAWQDMLFVKSLVDKH